jgi:hypothetical protein
MDYFHNVPVLLYIDHCEFTVHSAAAWIVTMCDMLMKITDTLINLITNMLHTHTYVCMYRYVFSQFNKAAVPTLAHFFFVLGILFI